MRVRSRRARAVLACTTLALCIVAASSQARAQQGVDQDARTVLAAMSNYLGGLKSFSVEYAAADEVVTPEGEKLQFLHSGQILVQRPDKLYAVRRGAAGAAEMILDGKEFTLYGKNANAYLQLEESSIQSAVDAVHNLGFDAPGADLLAEKPLDSSTTDMTSGVHVGMTTIDGIEVHQLAFRGKDVDWQLWVTTGDKPLPVRYVVTTKWFSGAPEFTLQLKNWNTAPHIDPARFTFVAPDGARKLDPSRVAVNAIGDMTIKGE